MLVNRHFGRAIFFDLDGTLIDSRADLAATVNHTRRDLGLDEISVAEILSFVGQGARKLLERAIPEHPADDLYALFMSHYAEHMIESVKLYPGVVETLSKLAACGFKLGVNSAKPNFAAHAVLKRLGIASFFGEAVISGGDCSEMKPSPLPILECSDKMGHKLTPADWMVGDNWTDLMSGRNAGIKTCFCKFGFGVLKDVTYDAEIDSFWDLTSVVLSP